ncbi:MAG TPA: ImmA/IrrE family metallo-endopeptidase [Candidatus Avimuribaculum pullicola]|nr:ImmA/IrrE family metallo-endopeptidase [Candidatus Avimuribaculum pullicola]
MAKLNKFIIEKQVSAFRRNNGFSSSEPITLKSLLLKLNVLTIFRPLSENFSGMCLKDSSGHRFMLINSAHPRGRQHFTIAHELYHLFIEEKPTPHKCNPGNNKDYVEMCADTFASYLLMPESGICQLIPENELKDKNISIATVLKLEHYFSVSRSALLFRLLNIGIINEKTRSQLASIGVKYSARCFGYDTALYEEANEGLVIGDFGEKARNLFEQEKISESHYIELLRKINIDGTQKNEDCAGC